MIATAKCAMPVALTQFRANEVPSTRRVPTLANVLVPITCYDPHKESFSRDLLRCEEIRGRGPRPFRRRQDQTEATGVYRRTHGRRALRDEFGHRVHPEARFEKIPLRGLLTPVQVPRPVSSQASTKVRRCEDVSAAPIERLSSVEMVSGRLQPCSGATAGGLKSGAPAR